MPTYAYSCVKCTRVEEHLRSISEYLHNPLAFFCCGEQMQRFFGPSGNSTLNPLAGDRSYAGLRAPDGSDISTRSKHREYMRRNGLTTADDFTETWKRAEAERDRYRTGQGGGAVTRDDIARVFDRYRET
jgi:hypothetical protein